MTDFKDLMLLSVFFVGCKSAQKAQTTEKTKSEKAKSGMNKTTKGAVIGGFTGVYLEAAQYAIEAKGDGEYAVTGDLTIRGVTKSVTLAVEFGGVQKNPWGQTVAGVSAHGSISRKDFGIVWGPILEAGGVAVGDKVKLEIEAEAQLAE